MDKPPKGFIAPTFTRKKLVKVSRKDEDGDGGRGTWGVGRGTWDVGRGTGDGDEGRGTMGRGTWRGTPTVYLFTVYCSLFAPAYAKASAAKIHYSLFTVYCLLFTIHCSLLPQLNF